MAVIIIYAWVAIEVDTCNWQKAIHVIHSVGLFAVFAVVVSVNTIERLVFVDIMNSI